MADDTPSGPPDSRTSLVYENPRSRRTVVRMALMYTPMAIAATVISVIALLNLIDGAIGAIVGVLIVGTIAIAAGFQAVTAIRDLGARPVSTRGVVERLWDKGTVLWMSRTYYALIQSTRATEPSRTRRQVFVVTQEASLVLAEGASVLVEHWPHTHTVIRLSKTASSTPPRERSSSPRRGRPTR